jgi:hypothetical protein
MVNLKLLAVIVFLSGILLSCKKEDEGESCNGCPVGGSIEPVGFTYTKNSGATITADSAFFFPSTKIIMVYFHGMTNRVIIKTTSQATGVYNFNGASNTVTYIEPLGSYSATGGVMTITKNANNKMSGTFTSSGGGVASSINGQFKDIPKK